MSPNARKNIIYSIVLLGLVLIVYLYRSGTSSQASNEELARKNGLISWNGEFMDQPYLFLYHPERANVKDKLDSLLTHQAQLYSVNSPSSALYQLNRQDSLLKPSKDLLALLRMVSQDSRNSENTWDPSSGILYEGWSFSTSRATIKDSVNIAALLENVGMPNFILSDTLIRKAKTGLKINLLDYGQTLALAQVALFLERQGVRNYFLQIGKYTLAKVVNERQELWKLKTKYPDRLGGAMEGWVALQNRGAATAGDFTQSYKQDSIQIAWVLYPRTGSPVNHGLLQTTVLAKTSKEAAILAQSLLVRGWQDALRIDSARKDIEMILIYNEKGKGLTLYVSPELKSFLSFPIQ
jgi:thiamine biosynthesis lipoprotein